MDNVAYRRLQKLAAEPAAQAQSVDYIARHLRTFMKTGERVLICFPEHTEGSIGRLMEQATLQCGGVPVIWDADHRWKTLLQQAFFSRAGTIIGPPLILLGLTKLKKYNGIPLYIRHAVTAGYPCLDWMIDGIVRGLDCKTWGSFSIGQSGIVAGFSCGESLGVHIREDVYGVDIVDDSGNALPAGEPGEIVLYSGRDPQIRLPLGEGGRIDRSPCKCGCTSPRLMDIQPGRREDSDLAQLGQYLHSWTSVLDCRLAKGKYGMEMEMIVFPGEKLPKLPSAAKQIIRPWDPKHDMPFFYFPAVENVDFSAESH